MNIQKIEKKEGNKRKRKFLAALAAAILFLNGCSKKEEVPVEQNIIGYEDLNSILGWVPEFINYNIKEENFVLLNAGDNNELGAKSLEAKIKYCNEHNISVGLVVSANCEKENEMYDNVEIIRDLISKHNIDMPVYLNIDEIITNDNLNVEQKNKLIEDFLLKCNNNNIYCGVYGSDTNLVMMKNYCGIEGYDACLIMDKEEIEYDGTYNIIKNTSGELTAQIDLAKVIKENDLNNKNNFVSDLLYIVKENDNIDEIVMKYGMSVNELLAYNNLSKNEIKADLSLVIPAYPVASNNNIGVAEKALVGLDLSEYQKPEDFNWESLKEKVDFVILRSNYGTIKLDDKFKNFVAKCQEYNMPIGMYNFTLLRGYNHSDLIDFKSECKKEYETAMKTCENISVTFPYYLDMERNSTYYPNEANLQLNQIWSSEHIKIMLDEWYDIVKEHGGIPGIYCNEEVYNYLNSVYPEIKNKFELWLTSSGSYGMQIDSEQILSSSPEDFYYGNDKYLENAAMIQITEWCYGFSENEQQNLDVNYSIKDYREKNYGDVEIKAVDRPIDWRYVGDIFGAIGLAGIGIGGIGAATYYNKKKRKK